MNKEELLSISKLVYQLSVTCNNTYDLNVMLKRLFAIFSDYPNLPLNPSCAVVLINPRGCCFQVAQFGMEPAWKSHFRWNLSIFENAAVFPNSLISQNTVLNPREMGTSLQLLLLPLIVENQVLGYAVLFSNVVYRPSASDLEFMSDLSRTVSGMVQRVVNHEVLNIRDFELEETRKDAIRSLGMASQYRDDDTGWHIMRMTNFAMAIAKAFGMSEKQRELLHIATPMHDVGKIGIPDAILLKPEKLSPEEFEIMKTHTDIGVSILSGKDPMIVAAREIAGSHHERWDGTGYPNGLSGDEIPILARICAVADVFDALTSKRPYKEQWEVEEAIDWVISKSGTHFDPDIVCAFEVALPEILRIRELYRDDIIDPRKSVTLPSLPPRANSWVAWDKNLSVGIDTIDEHHRYLFDLINDLFEVVSNNRGVREVARLINATDAYAKVHFRAEEQMMRRFDYAGIHLQEQEHQAFETKIREFYEELYDNPLIAQFDVLSYLRDWLIHHIRIEDAKLSALVSSQ